MKKKINNYNRKNTLLIVIILTMIISVSGATYAYFAVSATNDNTVRGTAATVQLSLEVEKFTPSGENEKNLVPQLSYNQESQSEKNTLKLAINNGCVDANDNLICQVYKVVIHNESTANLRLRDQIKIGDDDNSKFNNLKWFVLSSGNNVEKSTIESDPTYTYGTITNKYGNNASNTSLGPTGILNKNLYRYYYFVVWIEEIDENQNISADSNKQDYGTYKGEIDVETIDVDGNKINGLTSTFTG